MACTLALALGAGLSGCRRASSGTADVVYVAAKGAWLRDRVAPVSSKVAPVSNGEKLKVLDRERRFLKVQTPDAKTGWIEEHSVIDQQTYNAFQALNREHAKDPVVATGVLRDELFAHLSPGRDTEHYFLLPDGDKLQLLERASIKKLTAEEAYRLQQRKAAEERAGAAADRLMELIAKGKGPTPKGPVVLGKSPAPPSAPDSAFVPTPAPVDPNAPPPQYEDWWLVRDAQGNVGWLLARRMDVDVPDEVVRYAEGQRIVGAYLLAKIADAHSPFPDGQAPEYVMVLSPYQDGLPYAYSRVRLLVWNDRKHRYEGGLRMNDVVGYLPVVVGHETLDPKSPRVPTFTLKLGAAGAQPGLDPETGRLLPVPTVSIKYRLDGETVRRIGQGSEPMPKLASSAPVAAQMRKAERAARRHHR
ncbi:MAG TPA: SH3 domain-containing protein [Acidobacteriaceae bacterium]|nr:SH3 domain-containing protein [Acidobacteriaceae bacterium]